MDLKDKLNFVWKFAFLAIFTYGVISMTDVQNHATNLVQKCSTAWLKVNVVKRQLNHAVLKYKNYFGLLII